MKVVAALCLALAALCASGDARSARLDPRLHRKLRRQGTANVFVTMQDNLSSVLAKELYFDSRGAMIKDLVTRMQAFTNHSQEALAAIAKTATLEGLASEVRHFWITNEIFFRDASWDLVEQLIKLENAGIAEIREEEVLTPTRVMAVNKTSDLGFIRAPAWGVQRIQAPSVWASGNLGQGVVVGIMDTGVRSTHEALRENFRGSYGWYDPETKSATPFDQDRASSHGTHVTASAVGGKGIGVAPGAQWMACKACRGVNGQDCTQSDITACAQFMLCPTDPSGNNKDCSKAPRIVNLSFGATESNADTIYTTIIPAWQAANIIPVASIGNKGPGCTTTSTPGRLANVIGVGAVAVNDTLAVFSSRGPYGLKIKPDVSAPGVDIFSAASTSDTAYITLSGTSMAAPHVTGTIALMLSADPTLKYAQVLTKLSSTTDSFMMKQPWTGDMANVVCAAYTDSNWGKWPNRYYGRGLVNALSAVRGACFGLDSVTCESTFFCTWNAFATRCQRWW